jgi:iron complex transport system ATP-binding protein
MIFEVSNGCFTYPHNEAPTLSGVSFSVRPGEIMTILGRNGIGKTTLVKCISGILNFSEGCVIVDGVKMPSVRGLKTIGFVPQTHPLSFPYSVLDLVVMGRAREMGMLSIPSQKDVRIAKQALKDLGMLHYADRRCTELSGGELQMVFIARALAGNPEMLVMDEPESHLDFKNQFHILELVRHLAADRNLSCIINTHYPDHALRISDKTLLLGDGMSDFGPTSAMLTEENVERYFGVRACIADVRKDDETYQAFIVRSVVREK